MLSRVDAVGGNFAVNRAALNLSSPLSPSPVICSYLHRLATIAGGSAAVVRREISP